jgi:hypothetical protein
MLDTKSIAAFLKVAGDDNIFENRLAAIETLSHLPLSIDAWRALAPVAVQLLEDIPTTEPDSERAIYICSRIPVRSVRHRLGEIARDSSHPLSLACARELARRGDAAGLKRLLASPDGESMERLACLPLERLQVAREPFIAALSEDDTHLWAAVALARLGDVEPLESVYDALLSGESIFHGNPWDPYNALAAARPLPPFLHSFLVGLYEQESARLRVQEGSYALVPRDAAILVGGLTGIIDAEGNPYGQETKTSQPEGELPDAEQVNAIAERLGNQPFDEYFQMNVDPEQRSALAGLQPEQAGALMMSALFALEKEASASELPPYQIGMTIGNAMVDFAAALPEPIVLPVADLATRWAERLPHLPAKQLTWVLSRAEAEAIVAEFTPFILSPDVSLRSQWLSWARNIAMQLKTPPPFEGQGPGSSAVSPEVELIDDLAKMEECGAAPRSAGMPRAKPPSGKTAKPAAPHEEPRYIQAKVKRVQKRKPIEDPLVWIAGAPHLVHVRVGPAEAGWIGPSGSESFPYQLLPPSESHKLRVILSEPDHLDRPLVETIAIRSSGPSDVAAFRITPRAGRSTLCARITIAHNNRILQTALLTGRVVARAGDAAPGDRIDMQIEAVVRHGLQDLDKRARFDTAFALSQVQGGEQRLLALADEHSVVRGLDEIKDRIDAISACMSSIANDAETYAEGLDGEAALQVLRFLADNGRALHDFLVGDQVFAATLKEGKHLQIVNLTKDAYFPAEFIYDFATPAEDATLCETARKAFESLDFSHVCTHKDHETPNHPVVCPFGFWGLQRVIERHAYLPVDRDHIAGDFVLQAEPTETRKSVEVAGNAMLGVSVNVEKEQAGATKTLLQQIQVACPIHVTMAKAWEGWPNQVKNLRPSLIVTLPHVEEKSQFGVSEYFLEIGGELHKARTVGEAAAHYVRAGEDSPMPLVFLLGCNTIAPKTPIDSIVGHFRRGGAAIVVGTVGSVLGSHASKVALELVDALFKKTSEQPRPLGDLLLDVRRMCLGKKVLMALCVCAFGDADWQVHAVQGFGGSHVPN